jgi:hypothetical protein
LSSPSTLLHYNDLTALVLASKNNKFEGADVVSRTKLSTIDLKRMRDKEKSQSGPIKLLSSNIKSLRIIG